MSAYWIVVGDRGGARIHSWANGRRVSLVQEIEHLDGRKKGLELESDRPGRQLGSAHEDPHVHLAEVFARQIGRMLERGAAAESFDHLILVAGPDFLGLLRTVIRRLPQLRMRLAGEINRNLYPLGEQELDRHLAPILRDVDWQLRLTG